MTCLLVQIPSSEVLKLLGYEQVGSGMQVVTEPGSFFSIHTAGSHTHAERHFRLVHTCITALLTPKALLQLEQKTLTVE